MYVEDTLLVSDNRDLTTAMQVLKRDFHMVTRK